MGVAAETPTTCLSGYPAWKICGGSKEFDHLHHYQWGLAQGFPIFSKINGDFTGKTSGK